VPTDDPDRAVAHMIDLAEHANELKASAGLKAGRKLQNPVYAYSLAWSPDEAPTQAEQLAAAKETIKALGLENHQSLIVSHNDTDHPHVHVIVNRVCPETGRAAVMSNDRLKLSQWAQGYEERHGKIHCQARVENNEEREKGNWRKHRAESRKQSYEWKRAASGKVWEQYRHDRDAANDAHKPQLDALWQQRKNRIGARKKETKAYFKPFWRDLYKKQKRERVNFDTWMLTRLKYALRQDKIHRGKAVFFSIFAADTMLKINMEREQKAAREHLANVHEQTIRDACGEIHKAWQYDRDQLHDMHKAEKAKRREQAQFTTDEIWKKQRDKPANDFDAVKDRRHSEKKPKRNSFEAFFGDDPEAIEKAREQQEKLRKRNRQRQHNSRDKGRTRGP
jgi:hypothetical protein